MLTTILIMIAGVLLCAFVFKLIFAILGSVLKIVGGALLGPTGAVIGGTTGKKKSKTDYDLTSYTEVKSYQLNLSTLEHGLIQLKFGPNDKTLVEQLLYCLDLADNLKIDIEEEKELYKQGTEKRLNQLENEYKDIGYISL